MSSEPNTENVFVVSALRPGRLFSTVEQMSARSGTASQRENAVRPSDSIEMRSRLRSTLALSLIMALAAALRFVHLGSKGIWADEAFSIRLAKMSWFSFWHVLTTKEANMLPYYLLLRGWIQFGDSAWWVRLPSALAGVAAVPVVYRIGEDIFSRKAGMLAAFLVAINIFGIEYSQEARSYSLVVLLVSISFVAFFRLTKQPSAKWEAFYVLATVFAFYSHFFAALALLVQMVAALLAPNLRRIAKPLLVCFALVIIMGMPLFWFVLFRNSGQLSWIQPVHAKDLYHFFLYLTGTGVRFAIAALSFLIAVTVWVSRRCKQGWDFEAWSFFVVTLWLFLSVCFTLLLSVWKPIYAPRFLIFSLPAAMLLIGDGLSKISYRWLGYAVVVVFAIASVNPVRRYYADPGHEDWNSAVEFLSHRAGPNAIAYVPEPYCATPLNYALEHTHLVVPGLQVVTSTPSIAESRPIWLIECSVAKDFSREPSAVSHEIAEVKRFRGVRVIELRR